MAWIRYRPGGKPRVYWRDLAGNERSRTAASAKVARTLKAEIEACISLGRDWEPEITGEEPLLEKVAEAYVIERTLHLRADTVRMDAVYLDVLQRFAKTKTDRPTIAVFSKPFLHEFMAWLALPDTGLHERKREPVTIQKYVRAAQQLWTWAEDSDRWPGLVPRPRTLSREQLPDSEPQAVRAPTWEEMDRCVLACRPNQQRLATWLRYTGLRVGESLLIDWADIDMERGELTIRPEIDKKKIGRTIPLCSHVLDEIATWGKRDGLLIGGQEVRPREPRGRGISKAWKAAMVREAVWKRRPDHAFRRGFKSELLAAGAHADAIDYLQGHGAGSRWRYIDPSRLPLAEALAKVPRIGDSAVVALPVSKRHGDGK